MGCLGNRRRADLKRLVDVVLAALAVVVLAPLLLAIAVVLRMTLGSPILFRQARIGLNGRQFELVKFRTMVDAAGHDGQPLPDQDRLTSFGRLLRVSSIDELPELWNVLRGDMSLVGPRPLLVEYLPLYSDEQARRHEVRPGITGWAQVNGRNAISWDEKLALDVWYVDNQSLRIDLKILWLTLWKVLARHGISAEGEATVSKFTGNKSR